MYVPKHFVLQEWFPQSFYDRYYPHRGDSLWELLDYRILKVADAIREQYGTVLMNDWKWGGHNQYRGYRTADCAIGAKFSQHKFGRALDCITTKTPVDKVRQDIIDGFFDQPALRYVTAVEEGVHWLHVDVRNWNVESFGIKRFRAV